MANPDPTKARQARKARRRETPGTLEDARCLLWRALDRAGEMLDALDENEQPDHALALKAVHAISQGASAYAKIVEVGELEARIHALEQAQSGPTLGRGAA